jgi:hypothetical protein
MEWIELRRLEADDDSELRGKHGSEIGMYLPVSRGTLPIFRQTGMACHWSPQ